MKKTLVLMAALAACGGTQLFAQKAKEGVITFSLTGTRQNSVSTSSSVNAGTWSLKPTQYKTASQKISTANVLQYIGKTLHGAAGYYSSKAQLVLVQGELSGFFNITPELADATYTITLDDGDTVTGPPGDGLFDATSFTSTPTETPVVLATGRHFAPVGVDASGNEFENGFPPGHHQPWGQIYVKDPGKSLLVCDNVTYFFSILVEECYDCFYLNSFVTDTKFTFKQGTQGGPPCCTTFVDLLGNGKDKYYMTLTFDNTVNNPYLNPDFPEAYVGVEGESALNTTTHYEGVESEWLVYTDPIRAGTVSNNPYEARFTLNGIVTYTWNLKFLNSSDVIPDFIGSATYDANGYGFIGLFCFLLDGTVKIAEKLTDVGACCLDIPWYDNWYGIGWDQFGNSADMPSPINRRADLSYHMYFDEEYEPGEQFGSSPDGPAGPQVNP